MFCGGGMVGGLHLIWFCFRVLFPGGSVNLMHSGYAHVAKIFYNLAIQVKTGCFLLFIWVFLTFPENDPFWKCVEMHPLQWSWPLLPTHGEASVLEAVGGCCAHVLYAFSQSSSPGNRPSHALSGPFHWCSILWIISSYGLVTLRCPFFLSCFIIAKYIFIVPLSLILLSP